MKVITNVVVKDGDKILMVQENDEKERGLWGIPGGHLEEGEDISIGAIREIKEETGYDIKLTGLLTIQNVILKNKHAIIFVFTADIVGGEINFDETEIKDVKFIEIEKVLSMPESELKNATNRKHAIRRLLNGDSFPLNIISNFDFTKN